VGAHEIATDVVVLLTWERRLGGAGADVSGQLAVAPVNDAGSDRFPAAS
jgi:hypothetical protein